MSDRDYIESLVERNWVSAETAYRAQTLLHIIQAQMPWLPKPQIAPGPDVPSYIGINWRTDSHYVSADVYQNNIEGFYENLKTGALESGYGVPWVLEYLDMLRAQ